MAKSFWKTVRAVSVKEIAQEASRPFALAVVGRPDDREEILDALFPRAMEGDVLPDRSLIRQFDSTSPEAGFPVASGSFDIIIDAGGGRVDAPPGARIFSVEELGGLTVLVDRLLEERADLALSMGRRFPGLRPAVADRIIRRTAAVNAELAMLSALPGVVPVIAPLLPAGAIWDILILTKNQAMMLFRLAALYELPLDAASRSRDLAPLLGNAVGWRAVARELLGAVPGGVGLVARGSIAYAGTIAIGRGLQWQYSTGSRPTRAQITRFYRDAYANARELAEGLARRITPRRRKELVKRTTEETKRLSDDG